jgi:hypothetical protein
MRSSYQSNIAIDVVASHIKGANYAVLDCGVLPNIANGNTDQSGGTGLNALTNYTCDPNFTLLGDTIRMCGSDEVWTNSEPSCAST